ncbi:hypothetical protein HK101_011270 [Irineochytrium annulatum]|nr:hypothetical protein HK101_011270 [Irineochytrium annulatum]
MASNTTLALTAALETYGSLFYVVIPARTTFARVEDVPKYITHAYPFFIMHICMELLFLILTTGREKREAAGIAKKTDGDAQREVLHKKRLLTPRMNDMIGSVSAGMTQQVSQIFFKAFGLTAYTWVYDNCHLIDIDPTSGLTWLIAFLGVDLGYYLFHRYAHEINIFWSTHIVHHSSEEYNQTTALRQSVFQPYISWVFYLPLALVLPPPVFVVHSSFNTLFQFWIHTETIPKLGYLEYIINTPSSHRVHHGRNPYCIDTNYAGTLIIWDIMFGTYREERDDEPVLYGLTHGVASFDPIWIQMHHVVHILKTAWVTPGIWYKFCVFFAGPGWNTGKPSLRLGDPDDIPRVPNLAKNPDADIGLYNPDIALSSSHPLAPRIMAIYVLSQFMAALIVQTVLQNVASSLPLTAKVLIGSTVIFSLWVVGRLLDGDARTGRFTLLVAEFVRLVAVVPFVAKYVVRTLGDPLVTRGEDGAYVRSVGGLENVVAAWTVVSLVALVVVYGLGTVTSGAPVANGDASTSAAEVVRKEVKVE